MVFFVCVVYRYGYLQTDCCWEQILRKECFEELLQEHKLCSDYAANDAVRFAVDDCFTDWVDEDLRVSAQESSQT